jgi:hypothetical protein
MNIVEEVSEKSPLPLSLTSIKSYAIDEFSEYGCK